MDCIPFLEAIEKHVDIYRDMNIAAFTDGISLPGLTLKNLFQSMPKGEFFSKPSKRNSDLVHLISDNLVGGPSIIFHRHLEAGVTQIRPHEYHTCLLYTSDAADD